MSFAKCHVITLNYYLRVDSTGFLFLHFVVSFHVRFRECSDRGVTGDRAYHFVAVHIKFIEDVTNKCVPLARSSRKIYRREIEESRNRWESQKSINMTFLFFDYRFNQNNLDSKSQQSDHHSARHYFQQLKFRHFLHANEIHSCCKLISLWHSLLGNAIRNVKEINKKINKMNECGHKFCERDATLAHATHSII